MNLIIKYIGNDDQYWSKLKSRFAKDYADFSLSFINQHVDENFEPRKTFVETYEQAPHIVYIDFSIEEKKCLYFCKLYTRNNTTRLSSLVALHEYGKGWGNINKCLLASVRINHFKSGEVQDVVYDPVTLLNVDLAKDPEYVYGKDFGKFALKQILRVSYVEDDLYHVETNSKLELGKVLPFDGHPLNHLMESNRFYIKTFSDTDLYYNSRFSYDLEFAYGADNFFQVTEESWLLYKKYKDRPVECKDETGKRYKDIVDDVKKRKSKVRVIREEIRNWIEEHSDTIMPKKLKVMVIDNSMKIFSELDQDNANFKFSINIQNSITEDNYQIKRTKPHLIVIHYDDVNNMKSIQGLISKFKAFKDYAPYVLIFNYTAADEISNFVDYKNILTFKGDVELETIKKMATTLDNKQHLSDSKGRVYFETSSPQSIMTYTRDVKVLTMTESIIYFISEVEIPMWTTFIMEQPTKMLVTVVPHKTSGKFSSQKNCYRAMISALGESEKMILRQAINKSLQSET